MTGSELEVCGSVVSKMFLRRGQVDGDATACFGGFSFFSYST